MKLILIFLLAMFNSMDTLSQHCCGSSEPTAQFASFTSSATFRSAHAEPLPYALSDHRGTTVNFDCADGHTGAGYLVKAKTPSNRWVFMVHEWWGLNDYVKHQADELHEELGDVNVLALDLYDGKVASDRQTAAKYMSEANEQRCRNIIRGAMDFAGSAARVCTIGWCFGGGWSLQSSLMLGGQAAGCVVYYGMPESDEKKLSTLSCPVVFILAEKDGWITPDLVTAFEQRMKRLNKSITVHSYHADHAFANPSNPHYNTEYTKDAWTKSVEFIRAQLKK